VCSSDGGERKEGRRRGEESTSGKKRPISIVRSLISPSVGVSSSEKGKEEGKGEKKKGGEASRRVPPTLSPRASKKGRGGKEKKKRRGGKEGRRLIPPKSLAFLQPSAIASARGLVGIGWERKGKRKRKKKKGRERK